MPNKLPLKPRVKALPSRETKQSDPIDSIDWLALWTLSLAAAALVLALITFFAAADQIGAAFILGGAGLLMALVLSANARGWL